MADENATILQRIYDTNPEIRDAVQRHVMKENPAAVFPEQIAKREAEEIRKTFGEKLEETGNALLHTRVELQREKRRNEWIRQGYDPDAIEQTIEKYGLTGSKDLPADQAAIQILEREAQTAAATPVAGRDYGRLTMDDEWGKLRNAPGNEIREKAAEIAHKVIDEMRSQRGGPQRFQNTGLAFKRP
jgi:hypothetical protein